MQRKQVSSEPVKMRKVVLQPQPSGSNFAELVINSFTIIDELDPIKVNFERSAPTPVFTSLNSDYQIGDVVNVRARVDQKHASEKKVFSHGRNCRVLNNGFLFDASGSYQFTLWDDWIDYFQSQLQKGVDYFEFCKLVVREWNGEQELATCSETNVTVLEASTRPNVQLDLEKAENVTVIKINEFDSIEEVIYSLVCSQCGKHIKASKDKLVSCGFCGGVMRSNKLKQLVEVVIKCRPEDENHYIVNADEFKPYMKLNASSLETDKEELLEEIMALSDIEVSLNNDTCKLSTLSTKELIVKEAPDQLSVYVAEKVHVLFFGVSLVLACCFILNLLLIYVKISVLTFF